MAESTSTTADVLQMPNTIGLVPNDRGPGLFGRDPVRIVTLEFDASREALEALVPPKVNVTASTVSVEYCEVTASNRLAGRPIHTVTFSVPGQLADAPVTDGVRSSYVLARWSDDPSTVLFEREYLGLPTHFGTLAGRRPTADSLEVCLSEFGTSLVLLEAEAASGSAPTGTGSEATVRRLLGWKWVTSAYVPGAADVDSLTEVGFEQVGQTAVVPDGGIQLSQPSPSFAPVSSRIVAGLAELGLGRATSGSVFWGVGGFMDGASRELAR